MCVCVVVAVYFDCLLYLLYDFVAQFYKSFSLSGLSPLNFDRHILDFFDGRGEYQLTNDPRYK